jgi:hypothetical protein
MAPTKVDAEPLGDDLLEIDPPPLAAASLAIWPHFDGPRKLGRSLVREARLGAFRSSHQNLARPEAVKL